jgi:hypothetical protein
MHRSGVGPLREQPLEHAPRDPDHAVVLADLSTLTPRPPAARHSSGRPRGGRLGNRSPRAILLGGRSDNEHTRREGQGG